MIAFERFKRYVFGAGFGVTGIMLLANQFLSPVKAVVTCNPNTACHTNSEGLNDGFCGLYDDGSGGTKPCECMDDAGYPWGPSTACTP